MRKLVVGITILTVVAGAIVFLWPLQSGVAGTLGTAVDAGPEASQVVPPVKADPRVLAEAKVVPVREASLSMPTSGIVAEVLAREGDPVEAGQLLLRLANAHQQAAVAQAQAALYAAQARLEELQQGPRPQEITAAQATLDAAQARLNGLFESPTPEEIAVAEAVVGSAQAAMGKLLEGASDEERIAARAEMANAQAELKRAQTEYDKLGWRNDSPALIVSVELEQATNTYVAAEARYEALVRGATEGDIAGAAAGVQQAEAELERVKASVKDSHIAAAQAEIHRAQAQLELLQAGARPEQVAVAEADVVAARAALEHAQVALGEAELRAPFAGTVASLDVKVGEAVVMGLPVAQLADLSAWWIETEDLTEMDVVTVKEGDPVLITVDALPDVELVGEVVRIKPIGVNRHGDMTYTVIVKPQGTDRRLRWNMTAMVAIEPSES